MLTLRTHLTRFATYCVIGAGAFAVDYSLFFALYKADLYLANVVGISAGIAVSFTLNRIYNFRKSDALARRAAKFVAVALLGMAVSTASIWFLVHSGTDARLAKAISMVVVFGFQFLANSFWTFSDAPPA